MWNALCDDAHEAHALSVIHRAIVVIAVVFAGFGGYALSTRMGAGTPPESLAYAPAAAAPVVGD